MASHSLNLSENDTTNCFGKIDADSICQKSLYCLFDENVILKRIAKYELQFYRVL